MSIVDDFKCYQNWGPDGYKFEVTPKGSDLVDGAKWMNDAFDAMHEDHVDVVRIAYERHMADFKHQRDGTYKAELSGGVLGEDVIKLNFVHEDHVGVKPVSEENYNNDLECIMSDDLINGLELASSMHHPDGRDILIQHRKKKMARKIADYLLENNFIHFREIEEPEKDQILLRGKLYAMKL